MVMVISKEPYSCGTLVDYSRKRPYLVVCSGAILMVLNEINTDYNDYEVDAIVLSPSATFPVEGKLVVAFNLENCRMADDVQLILKNVR